MARAPTGWPPTAKPPTGVAKLQRVAACRHSHPWPWLTPVAVALAGTTPIVVEPTKEPPMGLASARWGSDDRCWGDRLRRAASSPT
ncbi:hypothetical protein B296_00014851 [Ensete ventricosum]|uniref:Uncharacterized protein n=1 Tax=Ensete ventricosum TaxID=4639 RepID=A0A426ZAX0_ENSVE|nr:hypothetical protein B296_00014851 [Ensete ventricosum]